ncbi:alpha/beta hydrolase [Nocardia sp. 2]|uniref:Alpha/beta hydrolase n=1 Tax=Nocardia acididurans TaxID=2802282 RepID=A0ABS1M5B8_9NOCA|nr:alpha/beta hydrolase [Nocardia acididurans]MBL1075394.1 alpha/beta hydrolase [Nocardia acididurans]
MTWTVDMRLPIALGWVAKHPLPPEIADSYLLPSRNSAAVRKDLRRLLRTLHHRHTLEAATHFPEIDIPVLVAWAREDRLFPVALAERLARELPGATLRLIDDSYTFLPEDQPELLTEAILEFTRLPGWPSASGCSWISAAARPCCRSIVNWRARA